MIEFDQKASEQIKALERELARLTAERRLVEAKINGLKMYLLAGGVTDDLASDVGVALIDGQGGKQLLYVTPQRPGVKEKILRAALAKLEDGSSIKTAELVRMFAEQGIDVGGKDPIASVSSILSRDNRFQSNRKTGWSLTKESPAQGEAFDLQSTP